MYADNRIAIVKNAKLILEGSIDLIEGCRKIASMSADSGTEDHELFHTFINVADDSENFPIGKERRGLWNADYLKKLDIQKEKLTNDCKAEVFEACEKLIKRYAL